MTGRKYSPKSQSLSDSQIRRHLNCDHNIFQFVIGILADRHHEELDVGQYMHEI